MLSNTLVSQNNWLSVEITFIYELGYTIDSASVYNIGENKREFVSMRSLIQIKGDIIRSQGTTIRNQDKDIISLKSDFLAIQTSYNELDLKLKKNRKQKWMWIGLGVASGIILKSVLDK